MVNRVFMAVDVQNLWYGARDAFGKGFRVDYKRLKNLLIEQLPNGSTLEAICYVVESPQHDSFHFVAKLEAYGFVVKKRYLKYDSKKNHLFRTDWDVGITVDIMKRSCFDRMDTLVLVSGDGDFEVVCREVQKQGKEVWVCPFVGSESNELVKCANRKYFLDRRFVYSPRGVHGCQLNGRR